MYNFAGFRPIRTENGDSLPEIYWGVIKNSATITLGDAVKLDPQTGFEPADATSDKIFGYAVAFKTKKGLPLELAISGVDYDGTYTQSASGDTYVAASDNQTDKQVMVGVIPAPGVICSALLDAAKGTTTGSDKVGCYFDILTSDSRKLDESTATTTKAQFISVPGVGPADPTDPADLGSTTRILVKAVETQDFDQS
ncbi:MAG: hypothetical protein DRP08_04135 [Candidatus Aenigmatarchaeota archaeon]|nr:MAG: hypothetical protein DRP08_04135 [Candidatus Aenigmarchaeota archaeon]